MACLSSSTEKFPASDAHLRTSSHDQEALQLNLKI
jgi:hypothetical protein